MLLSRPLNIYKQAKIWGCDRCAMSSINKFQLINVNFLVKSINIDIKTPNMELKKRLKHRLKLELKLINQQSD